jgi:hypothetical protein
VDDGTTGSAAVERLATSWQLRAIAKGSLPMAARLWSRKQPKPHSDRQRLRADVAWRGGAGRTRRGAGRRLEGCS